MDRNDEFKMSNERLTRPSPGNDVGGKAYIGEAACAQPMSMLGQSVLFCPPQGQGEEMYAAIVTKQNGSSKEHGQVQTLDLVTFGPNSVYFQHNVPYSSRSKPGHWSYK